MALVEETRTFSVKKGLNTIKVEKLPKQLDVSSVNVEFSDNSVQLLEQNYVYQLLNAQTLLTKSVNKNIRIIHPDMGTIQGILLSVDSRSLLIETPENELRIISDYTGGQVVIEKTAAEAHNLITQPTLFWTLDAKSATNTETNLAYITSGLDWQAEYTAILDKDDKNMLLSAWVVLTNNCGKSFEAANLTLIAGDLHRADKPQHQMEGRAILAAKMSTGSDSQFEERGFFEYHIYNLNRKVDLEDSQQKQIRFFPAVETKITKSFNYNYQKDQTGISVIISSENSKENGLGFPLPMGRIRTYKKDNNHLLILGEDRLIHVPKDEKIRFEIGKAFDIKAERIITNRQRDSKNSEKLQISIEFKNRKEDDIEILVTEPVSAHRDYRILNSNLDVFDKNANQVEFIVPVKANNSNTLTFEILYTW
jgi:hypothetical protein